MTEKNVYDVLVVGAGISGINAAFRIQQGLPDLNYAVLEGRSELGGTWSMFKYPGIRSDSDLHTFGFSWDPWMKENPIADGASILEYLNEVAVRHGVDKKIKLSHKVTSMNWSSDIQMWRLDVQVGSDASDIYYARYVVMSTGYYDQTAGLASEIPGISNFKGQVVHPQFWPEDLAYEGKKVIVIGSGATAATLLPAMAEKTEHITMLQRSPGYYVTQRQRSPLDSFFRRWLPSSWAERLVRWRYIFMFFLVTQMCARRPDRLRKLIMKGIEKQLPETCPIDPHFTPAYMPGEQRICVTPNGDFFRCLRDGKASVVTDKIDTVTEAGIKTMGGRLLEADIIITATGLKMQFLGNTKVSVDNKDLVIGDRFMWRGSMFEDVPNLIMPLGYANYSWTLGSDVTSCLFVRLIKMLRKKKKTVMTPHVGPNDPVKPATVFSLKSNYVRQAAKRGALPKAGDCGPWVPRRVYYLDAFHAAFGDVQTGLTLS